MCPAPRDAAGGGSSECVRARTGAVRGWLAVGFRNETGDRQEYRGLRCAAALHCTCGRVRTKHTSRAWALGGRRRAAPAMVCRLSAALGTARWHPGHRLLGEGKDVTLRSRPSLQSLVRWRQNGQEHPSLDTAPDEGLRRRHPTVRPRPAQRPTCDPAHCNGPRVAAACYGPNLQRHSCNYSL
jgi:hypothetical protein